MSQDPHADVAGLADGSLPPGRRTDAEARVARSPELQAALDRQRAALEAIRTDEHHAPDRLRSWLQALGPATGEGRPERAPADEEREEREGRETIRIKGRIDPPESGAFAPPPWRAGSAASAGSRALPMRRRRRARPGLIALGFVVLACAIGAAVIVSGREDEPPAFEQAAALGGKEPDTADARLQPLNGAVRRLSIDGVGFPDWHRTPGWRAVGARRDQVGGHKSATVFYSRGGKQVAYTVLERPSVKAPDDTERVARGRFGFRVTKVGDREVAMWASDGRTHMLTSADVPRSALVTLGAYARGARPSRASRS